MPRTISLTEIMEILESGEFTKLLGCIEDEHLECKTAPYQLEHERERMELAKDASALANADGGIILIGVQTEVEPTYHGDIIRRVGSFSRDRIDFSQYQNVISDWVIPSIPGLKFGWYVNAENSDQGIASIFIPQVASRERPFLAAKVVQNTGRVIGSYVGYFERTRDSVSPMKPAELREKLRDGQRFSELESRLGSIEGMIGKALETQAQQRQRGLSDEAVFRRVQQARRAVGYEDKPAFSLAASSLTPVDFPNLFESREVPIVRLLEDPPRLRRSGFDLSTRRLSTIIEGQLRRCLIPDHKLLEVWRDGALISVVPGDDSHLCWAMRSTLETGLRINNLALTETVFLFCDWALKAFENAVPVPTSLRFRMLFSHMVWNEKPFSLNPYRPNEFNLSDDRHPAPMPDGIHILLDSDRADAEPGAIAYRLLADLFSWFGFDASEMPYADRNSKPPRIDPQQIG
jgi:hypothetical protein